MDAGIINVMWYEYQIFAFNVKVRVMLTSDMSSDISSNMSLDTSTSGGTCTLLMWQSAAFKTLCRPLKQNLESFSWKEASEPRAEKIPHNENP